ncbi:hypothetical protein HK103_004459 [Boothiomyces macroporosus]|uniref:Uncharacterized protein n=1 Tax=Boothiomyces macroporosus TaxID=261099 RepID=A0AAD5Y8E6_9FUNG|nr:hypothetical protein HK103_004459 [Boothiomyces macroporosus]
MVPQDQAIEIINNSLPEERRKEYFETGSNLSSASSFEKISQPSESPAMPRLKKPPSKAMLNWDKLRYNWKDAVKAELQSSFESWEAKRNQAKFWQLLVDNYRIE